MDVALTNNDIPLSLSLKDKPKKSLTCGETFKPRIYFATSGDIKLDLNYIAFSKGRIVASDTIRVTSKDKEDAMASLYQIGNTRELGAYEKTSQNQDTVQTKVFYEELELDIDDRVSPSLKLVVFANYGDSSLEDSHTYDIEPCQEHKVTVNWSTSKTYPGSQLQLEVTSDPLSLCGLAVTDKSVELLGNENKITKESIGKLQAQIGDRKTSRSENYWEFQRKCPDTYSALKVYQGSGIQVSTDLAVVKSCKTVVDSVHLSEHYEDVHYMQSYSDETSDLEPSPVYAYGGDLSLRR
jgi:hypothetical protein